MSFYLSQMKQTSEYDKLVENDYILVYDDETLPEEQLETIL